jgi:hypothetical protein
MNQKKQQQLIDVITSACEELGWVVGLPGSENEDDTVPGLVIGIESFVVQVVESYTTDYEVFDKNMNDDGLHQVEGDTYENNKKKNTYH